MQALARTPVVARVAAPKAARAAARAALPAPLKNAGVKLAAGAAAATQLTAALPALAVIEERMGGEGAGAYGRLPLGINDPILGFILAGVVVTVWGLYLTTGGNAGYEEEDSGLDL